MCARVLCSLRGRNFECNDVSRLATDAPPKPTKIAMSFDMYIQCMRNALRHVPHKSVEQPNRVTFKAVAGGCLQAIADAAFSALLVQFPGVSKCDDKMEFPDGTTVHYCPPHMIPLLMISRPSVECNSWRQSECV